MDQNLVRTYKYKVGKKTYIIIKITQLAGSIAPEGNAIASNQLHVKIFTRKKRRRKRV